VGGIELAKSAFMLLAPHGGSFASAAVVLVLAACSSPTSSSPLEGAALATEFESIAVNRASLEFPCPASELVVLDLGGYAYRVTGCGDYAEYECSYDTAQGNNTSAQNNNNVWIYECHRAAQDGPSRLDAGVTLD
jgi:hypothetical protein